MLIPSLLFAPSIIHLEENYTPPVKVCKVKLIYEDSSIRVWEYESRKLLTTWQEHTGWVTNLLYCKEFKVLFSASIDGCLIVWGPTGNKLQKIQV